MTQRELRTMLCELLARVGVPVYAADQVPPGAACPYMTYALNAAPWAERGALTVTAWTRSDFGGCVALVDRLLALLPGGQELVCGAHGALYLRFEQADMISTPADARMTGGRVRLACRCYQQMKGEDAQC